MSTTTLHPLMHTGTSQSERLLKAVLPDELRIDDRNLKDLLVAAHRYAELLHYYDEKNKIEGDWTAFWEVEALTFLATLAELDTDLILQQYNDAEINFAEDIPLGAGGPLDPGGEEITNDYDLVLLIYELAKTIDKAHAKLPDDLPLKAEIKALIDKEDVYDGENLVEGLHQLITIHKHAHGEEHETALPYSHYASFFTGHWGVENSTAFEAIKFTADYDRETLRSLFRRFYEVLVRIRHRATYWFDRESAAPRLHQPHVALFLTFLRLFDHARDSLNGLTKKHLDHYYEDLLCLVRREAVADDVYLVLELAKGFEENRIEKGTEFLAGKDKNGIPLVFKALEEYVVRGAKVSEIKTVHFDLCQGDEGKIVANPDVNLAYAKGEEDPAGTVISWRSMGDNVELPTGEIGFAIASPQLILREGLRVIDVEIVLTTSLSTGAPYEDKNDFYLELSSGEEWIIPTESPDLNLSGDVDSIGQAVSVFRSRILGNNLSFRIVLERDAPPVIVSSEDQAIYATEWPVLKVVLKQQSGESPLCKAELYHAIRNVKFSEAIITVAAEGIRENLIVQSDQGVFDGTQKVLPFGAVPGVGRNFYVGSTEIFQKSLRELSVKFDWVDVPQVESLEAYYCHYGLPPYRVPDPEVQIEFIDRADDQNLSLEQVTRVREQSGSVNGSEISLIVSQIDETPINEIEVTLVATWSTSSGNLIETPQPPINLSAADNTGEGFKRRFAFTPIFPPPQIAGGLQNIKVLVQTGASIINGAQVEFNLRAGEGNNGPWASELELLLFPNQLTYNTIGTVSGKVRDIGGAGLGGVSIENGTSDDEGNFSIQSPANVINFSKSGYGSLNITHSNFNFIEAYLAPDEGFTSSLTKVLPFEGIVDEVMFSLLDNDTEIETVSILVDQQEIANTTPDSAGEASNISGGSSISAEGDDLQPINFPLMHAREVTLNMLADSANITQAGEHVGDSTNIVFIFPSLSTISSFSTEDGVALTDIVGATVMDNQLAFTNISNVPTNVIRSNRFLDIELDSATALNKTWNIELVPVAFKIVDNEPFLTPFTSSIDADTIQVLVIDETGSPVAGAQVMAIGVSTGNNSVEATATSQGNGLAILNLTTDGQIDYDWSIRAGLTASAGEIQDYTAASPLDQNNLSDKRVVINIGLVQKSRPFEGTLNGQVSWPITFLGNEINAIDRAIVELRLSTGQLVSTVQTDGNGFFSFEGLATSADSFSLSVKHPYFINLPITEFPITDNSDLQIQLRPKQELVGHTGTIRDIFGVPQNNIPIAIRWPDQPSESLFEIATSSEIDGVDGSYRFVTPIDVQDVYVDRLGGFGFQPLEIPLGEIRPEVPSTLDIVVYPALGLRESLFLDDGVKGNFDIPINALNLSRDIRTQDFSRYNPTLKRGFLRFTLQGTDFGHLQYPNLLAAYTIALSRSNPPSSGTENFPSCNQGNSTHLSLPNPPYTPATNGISISYKSRQTLEIQKRGATDPIDHFFHLLPFSGYREAFSEEKGRENGDGTDQLTNLLDPFHAKDLPTTTEYADGNLYLGLEQLEPDTVLSLLFQIEEGTEQKPDWIPPRLVWSYLVKGNRWQEFRADEVLSDGTRGLTKNGLVKLNIPKLIVRENTMLNPALHWIRVAAVEARNGIGNTIPHSVHALPSLVSVSAQAIQARFANRENDLTHLESPLPATTVAKLLSSRTAIKKVEQPYASFNGRLPEQGNEFYRRVSERLRHRNRAITIWDYEHLLLEQFPKVKRVKCLSHTRPVGSPTICGDEPVTDTATLSVHQPGYVTLVVIPDLAQRTSTQQSEPRFSFGDLLEMEAFLRQRTNLFVGWTKDRYVPRTSNLAPDPETDKYLWVNNPTYQYVRLCFQVVFHPGLDPSFYRNELNRELKNYLAPWLSDPAADISFDRDLHQSVIIAFIEEREYVDVIGDFRLYTSTIENSLVDLDTATAVDSDLVRPAAANHVLTTFEWADANIDAPDHCILSSTLDEICAKSVPPVTEPGPKKEEDLRS